MHSNDGTCKKSGRLGLEQVTGKTEEEKNTARKTAYYDDKNAEENEKIHKDK